MSSVLADTQHQRLRKAGGTMFATHDIDDARRYMAAVFRPHNLNLPQRQSRIAMRHESLSAGGISFHWLRYGSPVVMNSEEMDRFYLFQINLRGHCNIAHGRDAALISPDQGYAVDPSRPLSKTWDKDCEQLIIRVDKDQLERFAALELGGAQGRLSFPFLPMPVRTGLASVASLVATLRDDVLEDRHGLSHPRVMRHLETPILSLLLSVFPHSLSDDFDRAAQACAPYYVRRAEQYIAAHRRDPIGLEHLVTASGVSGRSLFAGFKRFRGMTPMAYIKAVRLDAAYQDLQSANPAAMSVTDIAIANGFTHMSKFARDFRLRFGAAPSEILNGRSR